MNFYDEKGLGYCGLACVLCSAADCPGCKEKGCKQGSDCSVYNCAVEKGVEGCYACEEYPCNEKMLQGIRNKAFNGYARQFGKDGLLERLKCNFENGITYHNPDGSKGDYDILSTEEEIINLVKFGKSI